VGEWEKLKNKTKKRNWVGGREKIKFHKKLKSGEIFQERGEEKIKLQKKIVKKVH